MATVTFLAQPFDCGYRAVEPGAPSVDRVIVPLDGSPFAERALPVALWLAGEIGAELHLIEVVMQPERADGATQYLDGRARRHGIQRWYVATALDPAAAIVAATEEPRPGLVCLATHGRDRSAALLGSVAAGVLARAHGPVLLVGPEARPPCAADAPVVAAVEGGPGDGRVVEAAAGWATRLDRPLVIATVAEPVPSSFRNGRPLPRAAGPRDPEAYLAGLAQEVGAGCPVATQVEYDPISVRGGLVHVVDRTTTMLVIGAHRESWPQRAIMGSRPARIVHDIEVPSLVVPLDPVR